MILNAAVLSVAELHPFTFTSTTSNTHRMNTFRSVPHPLNLLYRPMINTIIIKKLGLSKPVKRVTEGSPHLYRADLTLAGS